VAHPVYGCAIFSKWGTLTVIVTSKKRGHVVLSALFITGTMKARTHISRE
jgi:hypothetical protein